MKLPILHRFVQFSGGNIDESRTLDFSFSSELPVDRYFGQEILSHKSGAADLSRLNDSAPLLFNHNLDDVIGVVESAKIVDGRGYAKVRFAQTARAQEISSMISDGILKNVSFGYRINQMVESMNNGKSTYTATDWQPFEVSIVSVPADNTVGVGRSATEDERDVILHRSEESAQPAEIQPTEELSMSEDNTAAIDVQLVATQAVEAERSRIATITALGDKFGKQDLSRSLISSGKAIDEARAIFLEEMNVNVKPITGNESDVGLTDREVRNFSFMRAINALANPTDRKAQEAAAFEFEASEAAAQKMGKMARGIMVPSEVLKRDLVVGTTTAGGHTVATDLLAASFIDVLRNKAVVMGLGTQMLTGLNGNIAIPRQTGGATAYWVAESGAPTESQQAFDQVTMSPKTVGAFTDVSRKLLLQSSIDVETFVRNDLATILAIEIDRTAIHGSGSSNQPTGIVATSGIGSVVGGTNGLAPAWSHIIGLETEVAVDNADLGALAYLTNTKVRGKLKQSFTNSTYGEIPIFGNDGRMNGYNVAVTNQVSSALTKGSSSGVCSAIIFGNFNDLLVGMWGSLDLMVDPYTASTSGTVRIVALQDLDIAVRHPESFAAMLDVLTT